MNTYSPQGRPIFLVSPRYRNEIASAVEGGGRPVNATRRARDAERRFSQSGAAVAIVDARGVLQEGLEIVRMLASPCEVSGAALLVLLSRGDAAVLAEAYDAGATHYLMSPFSTDELNQAIRFSERLARRLSGRNALALSRTVGRGADHAGWQWQVGNARVQIAPALALMLDSSDPQPRLATVARALGLQGLARARDAVRRLLASGRATAFAHELVIGDQPRRLAHHLRLERDATGVVIGIAATVEDLEAAAQDRRISANFDRLTGLANADFMRRWMETRLAQPGDYDPPAVLLLIALKRFDEINATYGRNLGDVLLQAAARRIERLVHDDDGETAIVGRLAGAEFGVALAGPVTLREATILAERLVEGFRRPFMGRGQMFHLACNIGIAVAEAGDQAVETLLRRASAALAHAKEGDGGGAEVALADEADEERLKLRAALDADLRAALDNEQIELLYQPQVEIVDGKIVGVEALVRWQHPEHGQLSAETVLTVAARMGLSGVLSHRIVELALRDAAAWPEALDGVRLSINLTAQDLAHPGFFDTFLQMVRSSGFPPECVTVEVTESGLIEDVGEAATLLASLRAEGLRVAADDFGTGYSSLAYLKSLPLDYLKLDKGMTADITGSHRDRIVTRGIIEMARSLGLSVIAEGVENEVQLGLLAREGCNLYQGFLCAPGLPPAVLPSFIERWNSQPH